MDRDFDRFFKANEARIHYQIHRLGVKGENYAAFYAEGLVAMWQAFKEYDASRGKIGTFINYRIRFRLIDLMRKKIRIQENDAVIIEEHSQRQHSGNQHKATGLPLIDTAGVDLPDDSFWREVHGRLSKNQWKWVHYFIICDMSVKEIMELENVTEDAVKGWGRAVRRKLRQDEVRRLLEELV